VLRLLIQSVCLHRINKRHMQFSIAPHVRTKAGIYAIRNSVDARLYIGSAQNFYARYASHKNLLKSNSHHASSLQVLVDQEGLDILSFDLVEQAEEGQNLSALEQKWLDVYQAYNPAKGFNKASTVKGTRVAEVQHKLSFPIPCSLYDEMSTLLTESGTGCLTTLARVLLTSAVKQRLSGSVGKLLDIELNISEARRLENLCEERYLELAGLIRAFLVSESHRNTNFDEIDEKALVQKVAKARGMKVAELTRSLVYDEAWRLGLMNSL
jgi:hypothetical protein